MDFKTILIYSLIQQLLIFTILFLRKFRNIANLFLGAIIVVLMMHYAYLALWYKGVFSDNPHLIYSIFIVQLLPPPIIWYYAKAYITGSIVLSKKDLIHLTPFAAACILFIPLVFNSRFLSENYLLKYNFYFGTITQFASAFSFLLYGYSIIKVAIEICGKKEGLLRNLFDFSEDRFILIKVLAAIIFFNGFNKIALSVIFLFNPAAKTFYYIETGIVIFLGYWLFIAIIVNPKIIHFKASSIKVRGKLISYDKSGLNDEEALEYMRKLNDWMLHEKPYLTGNLCLADLSEKIEVPGHTISEILNRLVKQNFYDYVNNYRIEEFKRLVNDPKNKNEKLLHLAFQVGFNSKSTFNTAFKKITGQTPSEYKQSIS